MILAEGKIYDSSEQNRLLESLEEKINHTRSAALPDIETVISAADRLSRKICSEEYEGILKTVLADAPKNYIQTAAELMKADNIRYRLKTELGAHYIIGDEYIVNDAYKIKARLMPLGTLFHIAAGNMEVLPAFSLLEGLLTGNVNILKLPNADNGLTVELFRQLICDAPELAPYIYIFDTPSSDIAAMKKMAEISDGIAVWGGDEAVSAVRTLAPVGAKLIEWGHKLSFAYISGYDIAALKSLAEHIITTKQLLCSSCQTIYLDTESMEDIRSFCKEFLPVLENAERKNPIDDIGTAAQISVKSYTDRLERIISGKTDREYFRGEKCCLTACEDSTLELSSMYGNCLVKRLPEKDIINTLRAKKEYLQTAGLICSPEKRERLINILAASGVNRIMSPENMSASFCGEAHDGEYPLRRYSRIVNIETG